MDDEGLGYQDLIEKLRQGGYDTNTSRIQRLRDGVNREPPSGLMWAIARLGFVKKPDGQPYTLEELFLVGCESLDPRSTMHEDELLLDTPYPEAVAFLRERTQGKDVATLARSCNISINRMRRILRGELPTWVELLKLGAYLFPSKNPEPLARLYGVNVDAPILNRG